MNSATGQMAVAEALGELRDPRTINGLTRLLHSRSPRLRETALNSHVQIDPEWTSTEPGRAALDQVITRLREGSRKCGSLDFNYEPKMAQSPDQIAV